MTYWKDRQAQQTEKILTKSEREIAARLARLYRAAALDITRDMELLYSRILEEGEDTLVNNYYRYNRYNHMRDKLNRKLTVLGYQTIDELEKAMMNMYLFTSKQVLPSLGTEVYTGKELTEVINSLWDNFGSWSEKVWCSDGLKGSDRVAKSLTRLQQTLEKGMTDCVVRGVPKDELVKTLMTRFDVAYSDANRLARTELNYIRNQSTLDSYKTAGVDEYEYLAYLDDRTSEVCEDLNGKKFPLELAEVGLNYPPMHPNCRCTVKAVLKRFQGV